MAHWLDSRRCREWLFLLLAPVLSFLVLDPHPVVRQVRALDPNIYTACMYNLDDLVARFGLTYYVVRFGMVLPGSLFATLFDDPITSFLMLRYALFLIGCIPCYFLVKRHGNQAGAVLAYGVCSVSPFLLRALAWNSPEAFAAPYTLGGAALLLLDPRPRWLGRGLVGLLCCLAINSNIFLVVDWVLLAVPYCVLNGPLAGWRSFARRLAVDLALIVGSCATCFGLAVVVYYLRYGHANIWKPTVDMVIYLSSGGQAQFREPGYGWLVTSISIYLPLFLLSIYACWRPAARFSDRACDAVFAYLTAVFGFHAVQDLLLGGFALRGLNYFFFMLPAILLALGFVAALLLRPLAERRWATLAALGTLLATQLAIVGWARDWADGPWPAVPVWLALSGAAAVFVATALLAWRVPTLRAAVPVAWALALAPFGLQGDYLELYSSRPVDHHSTAFYQNLARFVQDMPKFRDDPRSFRFWYSQTSTTSVLDSWQAAYLWQYSRLETVQRAEPRFFLGEQELAALEDVEQLVLLAESPGDLEHMKRLLAARQVVYSARPVREYRFDPYRVLVEILDLAPAYLRDQQLTAKIEGKQGTLRFADPSSGPTDRALPLQHWWPASESVAQHCRLEAGGLRLTTEAVPWSFLALYPPITVPADGTYHFVVRYTRRSESRGSGVRLGVERFPDRTWLGCTKRSRYFGNEETLTVTLNLKSGETVRPILTNMEAKHRVRLTVQSFEVYGRPTAAGE